MMISKLEKNEINAELLKLSAYCTYINMDTMSVEDKIRLIEQLFYKSVGYFPNIRNPKSFNEKLNWLKFNYNNPEYDRITDKFEFKKYIEDKLGEGYTAKILRVFDNVADLNFEGLPEKFVVKTTQGCGGRAVKIIKDKKKVNIDKLKLELSYLLNPWESLMVAGLPIKNKIKQRIIVEEYLPVREGSAIEYKLFCFHGKMGFCLIECDYFGKHPKRAIYDADFNEMPFSISKIKKRKLKNKPKTYDKMVALAEILSKDFPHVRVDLYDIDGRIYVGELTFYSGDAFSIYSPVEWDYKLGEWLDLSKINPEHLKILPEFKESAKDFIKC